MDIVSKRVAECLKLGNEEDADSTLTRKLKHLWNNGLLRSIFMLLILVLSTFAFQRFLMLVLRTPYPLQTPISNSMYPTLKIGDLLIVQGGLNGVDVLADPKNGDIIVFRHPYRPDEFVVHRAIEKYEKDNVWYFRTKGDHNLYPDSWVISEKDLIGKVVFTIPYLGYIKIYLGNEIGISIIVALLIVFVIFENLDLLKKKDEKNKGDEKSSN
ncbi:signal peptidase I [Candidatus Bathyarchaeota archaeon]|nr:signal peptidase I [Candidatus Bathyarchaeota archaeon]